MIYKDIVIHFNPSQITFDQLQSMRVYNKFPTFEIKDAFFRNGILRLNGAYIPAILEKESDTQYNHYWFTATMFGTTPSEIEEQTKVLIGCPFIAKVRDLLKIYPAQSHKGPS